MQPKSKRDANASHNVFSFSPASVSGYCSDFNTTADVLYNLLLSCCLHYPLLKDIKGVFFFFKGAVDNAQDVFRPARVGCRVLFLSMTTKCLQSVSAERWPQSICLCKSLKLLHSGFRKFSDLGEFSFRCF